MIGLILMVVGVLYLWLLIWATRFAYRWAKAKGFSRKKCVLAGIGGFFIIYLPVFWDHIPTLVAYEYYCRAEAGLWVYKMLEQWLAENGSNLPVRTSPSSTENEGNNVRNVGRFFASRVMRKKIIIGDVVLVTEIIIDRKTGDLLVQHRSVGSGYGNMMVGSDWRSLKFWLSLGPCDGEAMPSRSKFEAIRYAYSKIGGAP